MGGWKLVGCPTRERQIRWGQPAAVWVGEWQAALGVWVQNSVVVVHAPIHGRRKELLRPIILMWMICETVKPLKLPRPAHASGPRPGPPGPRARATRFRR
jgi:hypothetical protein